MNIETFISRAIEGGWSFRQDGTPLRFDIRKDKNERAPLRVMFTVGYNLEHKEDNWRVTATISEILLDPKAWQAVGKVSGWGDKITMRDLRRYESEELIDRVNYRPAQVRMHRFIDALCDGYSLEEALEKATI